MPNPTMDGVREMIKGTLTREGLEAIGNNDELQMEYAGQSGTHAIITAPGIYAHLADLPTVVALRSKAQKGETITVTEFEGAIRDIRAGNAFLGWVLDDGAKQTGIYSALKAGERGGYKSTL